MEIMFTSNEVFDIFTGSGGFVLKFKKIAHPMNNPFNPFVILSKQ